MESAVSSSMGPSPVRSQDSEIPNSRQIDWMVWSVVPLVPFSIRLIADLLNPILLPNCSMVRLFALRTSLMRSQISDMRFTSFLLV